MTRWLCASGRSGPVNSRHELTFDRVKPSTSAFPKHAYELTPTSLTLSDSHPNVLKRGGKAGRQEEYNYTFGELSHLNSADIRSTSAISFNHA
jgi:hypothetical protein